MTETTSAAGIGPTTPSPSSKPRIVVGTDLTPLSRVAIGEAARLAAALGAELEVVCVYRDEFDRHWTWPALASEDEVREHTEDVVRDAVKTAGFDPDCAVVTILSGRPARELIERSHSARLLVVGGRRESGVSHIMLGSVATQCVEHATVPVLVVHDELVHDANAAESGPSAGRIVVGVDGSASSIEALRWAATFAAVDGAGVDALAVWKPPMYTAGFGYPALPQTWNVAEFRNGGDLAKKLLRDDISEAFGSTPPPDLREIVEEGYPAHHLLDHSRGASLLVVGSRGHGGFASLLLGSVSVKCVNNARCPVLVIHVPGAIVDAPDHQSE